MAEPKAAPEVFAEIEGEAPALVPPGEYDLRFDHHETLILFGRASKLVLWFKIITFGDHFETKIARFYNIKRIIGRPGRNGRFKVGFNSDFMREYGRLFRPPRRLDRIAMSRFETVILIGKAKTVTRGHDQSEIPEAMQYSVLEELVGVRMP